MVRKDKPFKTLQDFIDYVKKQPPGSVTVGGSATSSANDLEPPMLNRAAGNQIDLRSFGGTGSAVPCPPGRPRNGGLMSYSTMVVQYREQFRFLAWLLINEMEVISDVPLSGSGI